MTPDDIIAEILRREGDRYTDHLSDRGGPTKYGITQTTLAVWREHPVTAQDVSALTEAEATAIYRDIYIERPGFNGVADSRLRALAVDSAVLHGVNRAVMWLQQVAGCRTDGTLGPASLGAINAGDSIRLHAGLLALRIAFIGRLITHDSTQAEFAAGWLARVAEFLTT